jgi:hypothetical protein
MCSIVAVSSCPENLVKSGTLNFGGNDIWSYPDGYDVLYMQDCYLGFIPYCFYSTSEKWSINSCFMCDFNSVDAYSIACISVGVSGGHSSKILGYGFGTVDALVPEEPCTFEIGGVCLIGCPADGVGCCKFDWPEIAN